MNPSIKNILIFVICVAIFYMFVIRENFDNMPGYFEIYYKGPNPPKTKNQVVALVKAPSVKRNTTYYNMQEMQTFFQRTQKNGTTIDIIELLDRAGNPNQEYNRIYNGATFDSTVSMATSSVPTISVVAQDQYKKALIDIQNILKTVVL